MAQAITRLLSLVSITIDAVLSSYTGRGIYRSGRIALNLQESAGSKLIDLVFTNEQDMITILSSTIDHICIQFDILCLRRLITLSITPGAALT